jgi:hypothetical protein
VQLFGYAVNGTQPPGVVDVLAGDTLTVGCSFTVPDTGSRAVDVQAVVVFRDCA